jgi:hypothetical protein
MKKKGPAHHKTSAARKKPSRGGREKKNAARSSAQGGPGKAGARSVLPEEYGENDLLLIAVDPEVVYASWEITRLDASRRGRLKMRLSDVTGINPAGDGGGRFLDFTLAERVGSGFFDVGMSGREVVAEIGNIRGGRFVPILRSGMVSFPVAFPPGESGIREEPESDTPIGY